MSYGRVEQICSLLGRPETPGYRKHCKLARARRERRRAKRQPESPPTYRRFYGWTI